MEDLMRKYIRLICALAVFGLAMCISAFGQETTGSIDVTVKDPNGAVVPNVSITVTNAGNTTGFKRTVTTNAEGFVRILQVPPGVYSVSAAATSGFKART